MKRKAPIGSIKPNPENPRVIKDDKFNKLVDSIKKYPKFFEKRPIVVDENMVILGGNMRFRAAKQAGLKEVWIDDTEDWTQEEKEHFIVNDNNNAGEWDWDMLANQYDALQLMEWGLDLPVSDIDPIFEDKETDSELKTKDKVTCPNCNLEFTP